MISNLANRQYVIIPILFAAAILMYSYNLEGQPRHGDEINYLGWAGNYIHLINNGDLSNPCLISIDNCDLLYHIPAHGATYSPLRMVLIGFPLSLTHQENVDYHDWSCYWFSCYDFHHAPTMQQMAAGRLLSPVFGALTIAVAFLVGKILFNRNVGLLFSVFFMFYNLWVWYSRTIMTEVHYVFFSMLAFLLLLHAFRSEHIKIKYFVSSGIAFGCALTSKLLSVEFAILFTGIMLFFGIFQNRQEDHSRKKIATISLVVVVFFVIAIFAFLLTEPGFYKNPVSQIISMKSDMDNYNRDVWFIAYPTIQGLHPIRMLLLFNYALFPNPIEHTIPGAYPNSTFNLGWNSPQTNSSIPMTLFFVIGLGYVINKIRKRKNCIPEVLLITWFVSTFFTTLMIARDLSLERYMLPFLLSIVMISSYGLWNFARNISNKKIQVALVASAILAHAATSLSYWQNIYQSSGTFWTNPLPYGTLQESITNIPTLAVNVVLLAFFVLAITLKVRTKITA